MVCLRGAIGYDLAITVFQDAHMETPYDAILILSFGGPEGMDDVMPFLENVTRGRNIPRERLLSVAHHYELFGGISPINEQNRQLIKALKPELVSRHIDLPVYWGNRNWHPFVEDTFQQMATDGVTKVIAFATSAYGSYSGCRMYLDDIARGINAAGTNAPVVHKLPLFYNHPLFIEANCDHLTQALQQLPEERRQSAHVVFTAHSVPLSMAQNCHYEKQLAEAASLTCARAGLTSYQLVYQSRSGPPSQPWLGPDICDFLKSVASDATTSRDVIVQPIGFISDHMEVMFDIEVEAKQVAAECGLNLIRAATAGTHPAFIRMIAELIESRITSPQPNDYMSCPPDCCPSGAASPNAARPAASLQRKD